jgi:hypothetical protein
MIRGQDWELNLRIRNSGELVYFDPRLEVTYYPRASLTKLAKQFFDTGAWRAELTRTHIAKANPRYFAPPVAVLAISIGLGLFLAGVGGILGLVPLAGYVFGLLLAAVSTRGLSFAARLNILIALPTMHFCWGTGFISGLFLKR